MLSEEVKLVGLLRIRIEIARNKVRDGPESASRRSSAWLRERRDAWLVTFQSITVRQLFYKTRRLLLRHCCNSWLTVRGVQLVLREWWLGARANQWHSKNILLPVARYPYLRGAGECVSVNRTRIFWILIFVCQNRPYTWSYVEPFDEKSSHNTFTSTYLKYTMYTMYSFYLPNIIL